MSLLTAAGLSKSYGAQDVFAGVSLQIPHQARIAVVGPNGVGKTSLLRILAGEISPDSGSLNKARSLRLAYLPQDPALVGERAGAGGATVWEHALLAFSELRQMQSQLNELEQSMANPRQAANAIERYGALQEEFETAGGYGYEAEAKRVLRGLGFAAEARQQTLATLSGGERTRALLAQLMLQDPGLLLLDEPTNHLDTEAVEWLESWLSEWPGAAVIVSHDRYFIDRVADRVWELTASGIEAYRGGYSDYVRQRLERQQRQRKVHRKQQEEIERQRDYIRRNMAGQNTRQAQGRQKRLERFIEEEAVDAVTRQDSIGLQLEAGHRSGDLALRTHGLEVGRDGDVLFSMPDMVVHRGRTIAIIGPNGVGKTSLLSTLSGELSPAAGRVVIGDSIEIGKVPQGYTDLDPEQTVIRSLQAADPELRAGSARSLLGRLLLSGDDANKLVGDLSGGERARLSLARLTRSKANMLLLDEPTHHLDLASQEVLQSQLMEFDGTILLVSHDRYLIQALADEIWAIDRAQKKLVQLVGAYDAYRAWQTSMADSPEVAEVRQATRTPPAHKNQAKLQRELQAVESSITDLETEMAKLAALMEGMADDHQRIHLLGERYAQLESELQAQLRAWEGLTEALDGA